MYPDYFVPCDFKTITEEEVTYGRSAVVAIRDYLLPKSVIDIGCGPGIYVDAFEQLGVEAVGIDIDERIPTRTNFNRLDIIGFNCQEIFGRRFDLSLSLEVGEHMPENLARDYVAAIATCADQVVFSAAQPGQGGDGHINCQPPKYWEAIFREMGYRPSPTDRMLIVADAIKSNKFMGWFVSNVQVFRKYESRDAAIIQW